MSSANAHLRSDQPSREIILPLSVETFDVFVRAAAEIGAELGDGAQPAVTDLIDFWLDLPKADDLVRDFIRGDLYSLNAQTREMVARDLGRLELEPPGTLPSFIGRTSLSKQLDVERQAGAAARVANGHTTKLQSFVQKNPEVVEQVGASSHEVLVMWVLLYLMHATEARERGNQAAGRYLDRHPEMRERLQTISVRGRSPAVTVPGPVRGVKLT